MQCNAMQTAQSGGSHRAVAFLDQVRWSRHTLAYMGAPDSCSVRQQISRVPRLVRDTISVRRNPQKLWYGVSMATANGTRDGRARTPYIRRGDSLPWAGRTDGTAGINLGRGRRSINHPVERKKIQKNRHRSTRGTNFRCI